MHVVTPGWGYSLGQGSGTSGPILAWDGQDHQDSLPSHQESGAVQKPLQVSGFQYQRVHLSMSVNPL